MKALKYCILTFLLSTPIFGAEPHFGIRALYGRSENFWEVVDHISNQSFSTGEAMDLAEELIPTPEEGIATFDLSFSSKKINFLESLFNRGHLGVGVEAVSGGQITNPVLPRLTGFAHYLGSLFYGLSFVNPEKEGWEWDLRTRFGLGESRRVDGVLPDFFPKAPVEISTLFFWSWELKLINTSLITDRFEVKSEAYFRPMVFHQDFGRSDLGAPIYSDNFRFRWKLKNFWKGELGFLFKQPLNVGIITVSGPQPLPIEILPDSWDVQHDIKTLPSLGSMVGLGTFLSHGDSSYKLEGIAGFFGGYLGAGAQLKVSDLSLHVGTWGVELTPNYRVKGARIEYVGLGYKSEF